MIATLILKNKKICSLLAAAVVALHIAWDHLDGTVMTHYLLAREDLPGISNWWGLLSIPLLSLLLISISQKLQQIESTAYDLTTLSRGFVFALLFGAGIALLWEFDLAHILRFVIWAPLLLAIFVHIHHPLYLLAFVLGTMFTFGGVLPIGIATVLLLGGLVIWTLFRILFPFLIKKIMAVV
ncbi:hypothetical protein [Aquimarina brevivitae]|uniref:Uncharacterized protein n=1 Tax=Aquimarina brevivitae TaxID=323412 RepID=A0A4Q7P0J3_9FLAO|nr:hypothetical protein [Aquimarina brevivitae]RZS93313.1 hypothetical protein EV197_1891 [Aquimarina brevivitae]